MFRDLKRKLRYLYAIKIKKMTQNEYSIEQMRKGGVTIGERCRVYTFLQSHEPSMIRIGNDVTVSSGVAFVTHDNSILKVLDPMTDVVGPITIHDNCFIGQNSILMLGVTLGETCIVGAGSVVTHSFPPHSVIAGNPARRLCSTEEMAEKYRDYAIDFGVIPWGKRDEYLAEHPEKLVIRK